MPFKLKHVFKAPTKAVQAIGQSGLLGQRGDDFRVLGVKVGKDLVPVVQAGLVIGTVAAGAPVLATAAAIPETTAIVAVSAASSAAVTGLSGGNESAVVKSCIVGAATAYVGNVAAAAPTIPQAVTIHVAGTMAVAVVSGAKLETGLIQALPGAVGMTSSPVAAYTAAAASGALLNDNPLRGALQGAAIHAIAESVSKPSLEENKPSLEEKTLVCGETKPACVEEKTTPSEKSKPVSKEKGKTRSGKGKPASKEKTLASTQTKPSHREEKATSGEVNETSTHSLIGASSKGVGVILSKNEAPIGAYASTKAAGIVGFHSETTKSKVTLGPGDVYENGVMLEKQIIVSTPGHSTQFDTNYTLHKPVVTSESVGPCIATRNTVTHSLDSNLSSPSTQVTTSSQVHFNVDCARDAGAAATTAAALIVAPEIALPVLAIQKVVN